jgi:hypothetical protein
VVARLLAFSATLFGEPLLGSPDSYPELARLLAVMAEAYHNRRQLRKPARVAYANYHRGRIPEQQFMVSPRHYLPREFLEQVGLPWENPYLSWATAAEDDEAELPERSADQLLNHPPEVNPTHASLWEYCLDQVQAECSPVFRRRYLQDLILLECDLAGARLTAGCRDEASQAWLEETVQASLERKLSLFWRRSVRVTFVVWQALEDA